MADLQIPYSYFKEAQRTKEDTEKIKKKVHDQNRSISEDRGNLTPPPNKMKIGAENTVTEMKYSLTGLKSWF